MLCRPRLFPFPLKFRFLPTDDNENKVCLLVSAVSVGGADQSSLAGPGGARAERSEMTATNPTAFGIIQSLLAECTPPVEAVCLQVRAT